METRKKAVNDFNPRSREGSDCVKFQKQQRCKIISIHAPAKGATAAGNSSGRYSGISIHAPAKGATDELDK